MLILFRAWADLPDCVYHRELWLCLFPASLSAWRLAAVTGTRGWAWFWDQWSGAQADMKYGQTFICHVCNSPFGEMIYMLLPSFGLESFMYNNLQTSLCWWYSDEWDGKCLIYLFILYFGHFLLHSTKPWVIWAVGLPDMNHVSPRKRLFFTLSAASSSWSASGRRLLMLISSQSIIHLYLLSEPAVASPSLSHISLGFQIKSKNMGGATMGTLTRHSWHVGWSCVHVGGITVGILQRSQRALAGYIKKTVNHDPFTTGGWGEGRCTIGLLITVFHGYPAPSWKMSRHSYRSSEVNCNLFLGGS